MAKVHRKRFWAAGLTGFAIFIYTLNKADLAKLAANLGNIDPFFGTVAVLSSALSYLCIAAVLHKLLQGMGFAMPFSASLRIATVSSTLNYVMAFGGLSGVAAKVWLLSRERVPPSNTLSISMVHGFLTNTVAVLFIYLGFFFLYSEYKMNTREKEMGIAILLIAFVLTWVTIQIILHEAFRKQLWQWIIRILTLISQKFNRPRWAPQERAHSFFTNFNESMNALVSNYPILFAPASFALLDWLAMYFCLKFAFLAVNYPVSDETLLVGFSVGIFAGLFSLTPVSIGVMEGSMAGSFYLMGLDYDQALIATLIYRLAYYFLPILASLYFYKGMFLSSARQIKEPEGSEDSESQP